MRSYVFGSGLACCLIAGSALSAESPPDVAVSPLTAPPPSMLSVKEGAYDVVDLQPLPTTGVDGGAYAISATGKIAGWVKMPYQGNSVPTVWGANNAPAILNTMCGYAGGMVADFGVNDVPIAACTDGTTHVGAQSVPNALVFGSNGTKYVGIITHGVGVYHPYTSGAGAPASLTVPAPFSVAGAWDVNKSGQAAGIAGNPTDTGPARAVRWSSAGVPTLLPGRSAQNVSARAFALNDAGVVVGRVGMGKGQDERAAMWQNDALTEIGSFGGRSGAVDINASGTVVGWSYDAGGDIHGFIYKGGKLTDLNLLVDRSIVRNAKGHWVLQQEWIILEALGINDAGVIVGRAVRDGRPRAVMLKPRQNATVLGAEDLQKLISAIKPTRAVSPAKDAMFVLSEADRAKLQVMQPATASSVR